MTILYYIHIIYESWTLKNRKTIYLDSFSSDRGIGQLGRITTTWRPNVSSSEWVLLEGVCLPLGLGLTAATFTGFSDWWACEWRGRLLVLALWCSQPDLFRKILLSHYRSNDVAYYRPTTRLTTSSLPHEQSWKKEEQKDRTDEQIICKYMNRVRVKYASLKETGEQV
jgi:hypothetical protein